MNSTQSIIKTEVISGSTNRYISHMATRWLERWWWTLSAPIIILVALGITVNQAWLLVAFMLLLLCYPSLLLLLFGRYALRSQARKAVFSYQITAIPQGMTITYFQLNDSEASAPPAEKIVFNPSVNYTITRKGLTINWGDTPYDFTFIPHEAFQSRTDSTLFIKWLRDCQTQGSNS